MQYEPTPPLSFEINGKTYNVTPIVERDYTEYLKWQQILAGKAEAPSLEDEPRVVLGDVLDDMLADGVTGGAIGRAMLAVIVDVRMGREAAEAAWETGLDPKALAAAIMTQPDSPQSNSTAAASKTPTPASSSGTKPRKRSSDRKPKG